MSFTPWMTEEKEPNPVAMLEQLLGVACTYWNRGADLTDMIALRGGGSILAFHWNPDTLPPSWILYRQGNDLFLELAGTVNNQQILNHLTGLFVKFYQDTFVQVHSFFEAQSIEIFSQLIEALPPDFMDCTLHVAGHSYGGSVGYLIAIEFIRLFPTMRVQFMGIAPSKAICFGLQRTQPLPNFHWSATSDPVVFLPPGQMISDVESPEQQLVFTLPLQWRHYSTGYWIFLDGTLHRADQNSYNALPNPLFVSQGITNHAMKGLAVLLTGLMLKTPHTADDEILLDKLNTIVNLPEPQADDFPFAVRDFIDIPFVNANLFNEPIDGPLTPDNVLRVNNVQGSPDVPGPGNAILGASTGGSSMPCKITFFYTTNIGGFSESWIANVPYNSITMRQHIKPYWSARKGVTGRTTFLSYVRIADLTSPRLVLISTEDEIKATISNQGDGISGPATDAESDISSTALLIRRANLGNTSHLFLRGVPDGVVDSGGKYDPIGGFAQKMANFIQAVVNLEWGWYHRTVMAGFPDQLVDATVNADGTLTFQTLNNGFFGLLANKNYQLTISQCRSSANLNGTWVFRVGTAANLAKTTKKGALGAFKGPDGLVTMYNSPRTFLPMLSGQVIKPVERRFGRPFGLAVGRAKNRPRG